MFKTHTLLARFPTLYVPETRRQTARLAAKEAKLVAATPALAAHAAAVKTRAATTRRIALALSSDPAPAVSAQSALIAPLLASRAQPRPLPHVPFRLDESIARAQNHVASKANNPAEAEAALADSTQNSVRSFRRTTVAGAKIDDRVIAPTEDGIPKDTIQQIEEAVIKNSPATAPGFAYGITAPEAKTVLLDAPHYLADLAERTGAHGAYDSISPSSTTAESSTAGAPKTSIEPAEMAELLRRQISMDNASSQQINKWNTKRVVEIFGRREFDTGSSEVQAAVHTVKINAMQQHLEKYKKDKSSKRQLQAILSKRATVLKYLRRTDLAKFIVTCRALGIEPDTIRA
ncbi:30S ribosomal protein S15 [Podochytrium sp. JEL0797]|nr:30S ribosomal protein S15 [Podochytrium sp. JEL0797]